MMFILLLWNYIEVRENSLILLVDLQLHHLISFLMIESIIQHLENKLNVNKPYYMNKELEEKLFTL